MESDEEILEYLVIMFRVTPATYFCIFIGKHSLPALMDSGSNLTLFGDRRIEIVQ